MSNVEVKSIKKGSLAERIGIHIGDLLLSYDGTCISDPRGLPKKIEEAKEKNKETVELILLRGDEEVKYTVPPQKLGVIIDSTTSPDTLIMEREIKGLDLLIGIILVLLLQLLSL